MLELMNNSDKRNCCETGPSRRKNAICPFFVVAVAALIFFFLLLLPCQGWVSEWIELNNLSKHGVLRF